MTPQRLSNGLLVLVVAAGVGLLLWLSGVADQLISIDFDKLIMDAGWWGPMAVVGLMTVAVVVSPLPSAPIAVASGAAYGHIWGTIYVIAGSEVGALIAFTLARFLGRDVLRNWLGEKLEAGLLGSQNALTFTVLVSRLLPFISFDIISYAAGLSAIHTWRFALATLAGIIPASFLLAHIGDEAANGDIGLAE